MKKYFLPLLLIPFFSCDDHQVEPNPLQVGMVYCTDGDILRPEVFAESGKRAKAVVFHVVEDGSVPTLGYAVSLYDSPSYPWLTTITDEDGNESEPKEGSQGTSCDIEAMDGDINTYNMQNSKYYCPLAFGLPEDFYIPSVAQMQALSSVLASINEVIDAIGGRTIPVEKDYWYWTSTEVKGMDTNTAWKFSPSIGQQLASSKWSSYKVRPILTVSRYPYK